MQRTNSILVVGGLALCALVIRSSEALPESPPILAGSYLLETVDLGIERMAPVPFGDGYRSHKVLLTLTSDGCAVQVDSTQYGMESAGQFESSTLSTWTWADLLTANATGLSFSYDLAGDLTAVIRTRAQLAFDDGSYDTGEVVIRTEAFAPSQDPLDLGAVPFAKSEGYYLMRRVIAE